MPISLLTPFKYDGPQHNFERDYAKSLKHLQELYPATIPSGFLAYSEKEKSFFFYKKKNPSDDTGVWEKLAPSVYEVFGSDFVPFKRADKKLLDGITAMHNTSIEKINLAIEVVKNGDKDVDNATFTSRDNKGVLDFKIGSSKKYSSDIPVATLNNVGLMSKNHVNDLESLNRVLDNNIGNLGKVTHYYNKEDFKSQVEFGIMKELSSLCIRAFPILELYSEELGNQPLCKTTLHNVLSVKCANNDITNRYFIARVVTSGIPFSLFTKEEYMNGLDGYLITKIKQVNTGLFTGSGLAINTKTKRVNLDTIEVIKIEYDGNTYFDLATKYSLLRMSENMYSMSKTEGAWTERFPIPICASAASITKSFVVDLAIRIDIL